MKSSSALVLLILFMSCSNSEVKEDASEMLLPNYAIRESVARVALDIEKNNVLESSYIGAAGSPSKQWARYELLKKVATEQELLVLTDHKNAVVRCYAFQALAANCSDKIYSVLLNHLRDTSKVETLQGCISMQEFAGDYFVNVVTPNRVEQQLCRINTNQRKIVDSLLVNLPGITLEAKSESIERLHPVVSNYARVRQLVIDERNTTALQILAKYKKAEDRKIICSFLLNDKTQYQALRAVINFPDKYFYPFIVSVFNKEWKEKHYDYPTWRMCYQALAKYPVPKTLELFNKTVEATDEFRRETLGVYLLVAIKKYPNPIFNGLDKKIRLSEYHMDKVRDALESQY